MSATPANVNDDIDAALAVWRQGDVALSPNLPFVHFADLARPLTNPARQTAIEAGRVEHSEPAIDAIFSEIPGVVILTQTCDIVRKTTTRPFVEVAPLLSEEPDIVEAVRRLRRPTLAFVPAVASQNLVADLNRSMTVEKSVVRLWKRLQGCRDDHEARAFAEALARHRARFAFPDDFGRAVAKLQDRVRNRHDKIHEEGAHLKALREIRVHAAPSWRGDKVQIAFWFIIENDPEGYSAVWNDMIEEWTGLFDESGRFAIEAAVACRLEDMTAWDYVESIHLDLDHLSISRADLGSE